MIAHDFVLPGWRRFVNLSGESIPPGAIMRRVSSFQDGAEIVLRCGKPDSTFRRLYVVNGPWEVSSGSGSEGICTELASSGLALCWGTPSEGQIWGPKPNQWELYQNYYGFEITGGTVTVAGKPLVFCKQHRVDQVYAKTQGEIDKNASGTVDVRTHNVPSDEDTTWDITGAYNRAVKISSGKYAVVGFAGHAPQLFPWECP
jgi:hypothetical protein